MDTLVGDIAAEAHHLGNLSGTVTLDVQFHQTLFLRTEGRHQVLHLFLLRQRVVGSHSVGHGGQREQRRTLLASLQVEHGTGPPVDPSTFLFG